MLCLGDCFFVFFYLVYDQMKVTLSFPHHWVRFILAFFNGTNFKWILQWNSGILLMAQFDFLVFTVSLTVIKFSVLSLASWIFIYWTDNNSITFSKYSDSILSLLFSFCNNSICSLIYSVCTVSCPITFSHDRGSIL